MWTLQFCHAYVQCTVSTGLRGERKQLSGSLLCLLFYVHQRTRGTSTNQAEGVTKGAPFFSHVQRARAAGTRSLSFMKQ